MGREAVLLISCIFGVCLLTPGDSAWGFFPNGTYFENSFGGNFTGNATYPSVNTTYPPLNTTYPPLNTTYPPLNTTYPPVNTTYPPLNTTYPPVNTTYPPGNSSGNPCKPNPCMHNGTCYQSEDAPWEYICVCNRSFTGSLCQFSRLQAVGRRDVDDSPAHLHSFQVFNATGDPCDNGPCQNNGTCFQSEDRPWEYICVCPDDFTGDRCQYSTDPCRSQPCQNGGSCFHHGSEYKCMCTEGFTGVNCTTSTDPCLSQPCRNGGSCYHHGSNFVCHCTEEYNGPTCANVIDACLSQPCLNGGSCYHHGLDYQCICIPGYGGINCDVVAQHGIAIGRRDADSDDFRHLLNATFPFSNATFPDFNATFPQINSTASPNNGTGNPCDRRPCQNNGTCFQSEDRPWEYICVCGRNFTGRNCENSTIDPCRRHPCQNGGSCYHHGSNFTCVCPPGFSGANCSVASLTAARHGLAIGRRDSSDSTDPCRDHPCQNGGSCHLNGADFTCVCPPGFDGARCSAVSFTFMNRPLSEYGRRAAPVHGN